MHSAILTSLTLLNCPFLVNLSDPSAKLFGKTSNGRLWEHILHYLVVALDPPSLQRFTDCYPPTTLLQAKEFRLVVFKSLDALRKTRAIQLPALARLTFRKSDLDNVRSDRFERLILAITSDLLSHQIKIESTYDGRAIIPPVYTPPLTLPVELQLKLTRAQTLLQTNELLNSIIQMSNNQKSWTQQGKEFKKLATTLQDTLDQIRIDKHLQNPAAIASDVERLVQTHASLSQETLQVATQLISWLKTEYKPITHKLISESNLESLDHDQLRLHPSKELALKIQSLSQQRQFQLFNSNGELDIVALIQAWMGLYSNLDMENSILW
ncbi:hypothetical protein BDEG_26127 [Batrachochytrium dendrobatidis JEL423]|uniref:HAUS augmin-like complex subunit 6 N-terminal domain-containing protein n=1 Tax=Batrachochytrium dendrobatidis (strain JEL423) TaxID=403673 RepID=A0A177WRG3_BATDL|nr:hypothetical protein BDEG_26127 [Batrachochytrium dendrobatidis JEL423]